MVSKIHKTGGNEIISLDLENFKVDMLEITNSSLIDFHFPKRKFTFNLKMISPLVHKKCKSTYYIFVYFKMRRDEDRIFGLSEIRISRNASTFMM